MNHTQRAEDKKATGYQQQLHPWCVVQHLPNMQNQTVARFRRRVDADEHQRALRQLRPAAQYTVVFDLSSADVDDGERGCQGSAI
ncbi:MAG: hypothetical protein AAF716_02775 [Cyanobacteria bacterium P01_D01_bin.1]